MISALQVDSVGSLILPINVPPIPGVGLDAAGVFNKDTTLHVFPREGFVSPTILRVSFVGGLCLKRLE